MNGTIVTHPSSHTAAPPREELTDVIIARKMLATALLNYRRAMTTPDNAHVFKSWNELTDIEQGFYSNAVEVAYRAIWEGR